MPDPLVTKFFASLVEQEPTLNTLREEHAAAPVRHVEQLLHGLMRLPYLAQELWNSRSGILTN